MNRGDHPRPSTSSGRSNYTQLDIQHNRNLKTSNGLASSRVSTPFQQWKTDKCMWSPGTYIFIYIHIYAYIYVYIYIYTYIYIYIYI
jgi:hypothetical protein